MKPYVTSYMLLLATVAVVVACSGSTLLLRTNAIAVVFWCSGHSVSLVLRGSVPIIRAPLGVSATVMRDSTQFRLCRYVVDTLPFFVLRGVVPIS